MTILWFDRSMRRPSLVQWPGALCINKCVVIDNVGANQIRWGALVVQYGFVHRPNQDAIDSPKAANQADFALGCRQSLLPHRRRGRNSRWREDAVIGCCLWKQLLIAKHTWRCIGWLDAEFARAGFTRPALPASGSIDYRCPGTDWNLIEVVMARGQGGGDALLIA